MASRDAGVAVSSTPTIAQSPSQSTFNDPIIGISRSERVTRWRISASAPMPIAVRRPPLPVARSTRARPTVRSRSA